MHIVHIATEMTPVAKVGGLGDVLLGLGRELAAQGHHIDIVIPKYDCMEMSQIADLTITLNPLITHYDGRRKQSSVWQGWVEGLKVYFIEAPEDLSFFNRGTVYGCADDADRFVYFSRAAIEFLLQKKLHPDIIHIHDWQTALVAPLMKDIYQGLGLSARTLFTIHNIEYQGKCGPEQLVHIGLNGRSYATKDRLGDNASTNTLNLMKGGVVYADFVNTVSPTYAKEVLRPEGGKGLEETLRKRQNRFVGILNGIDYTYWNPEHDRYLSHYLLERQPVSLRHQTATAADTKHAAAMALRERLGLADERRPIVGCVTRLVPQKAPDLLKHALRRTLEKGGQFVLLGSSPIPEMQAEFEALREQYTGHPHVSLILRSSEELAHLIFAGSDITVVPSIYEPCGLTQMIALRYGTIPVVRRTGGLADSIFDVDTSGLPEDKTNGYTFDHATAEGVNWGLDRALACWAEDPDRWHRLVVRALAMDFSWSRSVIDYLNLYKTILT